MTSKKNYISKSNIVIVIMGIALGYLIIDNMRAWDRVRVQEKFLKDTYAAARGLSTELKNCKKKAR